MKTNIKEGGSPPPVSNSSNIIQKIGHKEIAKLYGNLGKNYSAPKAKQAFSKKQKKGISKEEIMKHIKTDSQLSKKHEQKLQKLEKYIEQAKATIIPSLDFMKNILNKFNSNSNFNGGASFFTNNNNNKNKIEEMQDIINGILNVLSPFSKLIVKDMGEYGISGENGSFLGLKFLNKFEDLKKIMEESKIGISTNLNKIENYIKIINKPIKSLADVENFINTYKFYVKNILDFFAKLYKANQIFQLDKISLIGGILGKFENKNEIAQELLESLEENAKKEAQKLSYSFNLNKNMLEVSKKLIENHKTIDFFETYLEKLDQNPMFKEFKHLIQNIKKQKQNKNHLNNYLKVLFAEKINKENNEENVIKLKLLYHLLKDAIRRVKGEFEGEERRDTKKEISGKIKEMKKMIKLQSVIGTDEGKNLIRDIVEFYRGRKLESTGREVFGQFEPLAMGILESKEPSKKELKKIEDMLKLMTHPSKASQYFEVVNNDVKEKLERFFNLFEELKGSKFALKSKAMEHLQAQLEHLEEEKKIVDLPEEAVKKVLLLKQFGEVKDGELKKLLLDYGKKVLEVSKVKNKTKKDKEILEKYRKLIEEVGNKGWYKLFMKYKEKADAKNQTDIKYKKFLNSNEEEMKKIINKLEAQESVSNLGLKVNNFM